jgi:hypothetical protein
MAELEKGKAVSLEELMVTTLAMADAVTKLLIERGIIHVSGVQARKRSSSRSCWRSVRFTSAF